MTATFDSDLGIEISYGEELTVTVEGEIDIATAPTLRSALEALCADRHVLVDVANVSFIDSSGLNVFVVQVVSRREAGGSLHIRNSSAGVRRVLEIAGLTRLLEADGSTA